MINVYDSLDVTVIADGVITTGLADGDALYLLGQNEGKKKFFKTRSGIQGWGMLLFQKQMTKQVLPTVTLKATSPAVRQYEELSRRKGENALFCFSGY